MEFGEGIGTYMYNKIDHKRFRYESERLGSFLLSNMPISIPLARSGYLWNIDHTECNFCAKILLDNGPNWSYQYVVAQHHSTCPMLTNDGLDNVPIRQRERQDTDQEAAMDYITTRAQMIRTRASKQGVPYLNPLLIPHFLDIGYSLEQIQESIKQHHFENGLFPDTAMLMAKF